MNSLSFEFALLARMSPNYAKAVLEQTGYSAETAKQLAAMCALELPGQLTSDVETYAGLLGPEVPESHVGYEVPAALSGSTAHCFQLMLWPHLFWVVHRRPDGGCWSVGFQNQTVVAIRELEPSAVRVGLWSRTTLQLLADSHELYDGWDEHAVVRFAFGKERYEGNFHFGLLDDWKLLP